MHRWLLFAKLALGLVTSWAWSAQPAAACSCIAPTPEGSLQNASVVFEGQVLEVHPPQSADAMHIEVVLRVVRDFRNTGKEQVTIRTPRDSAACGYAFQVGESHLVYASGTAEPYDVSLCSGTQPMAGASEYLQHLGMGEVPVGPAPEAEKPKSTEPPPASGGCASCSVGATTRTSTRDHGWLLLGGLIAGAALVARARGRRRVQQRRSTLT